MTTLTIIDALALSSVHGGTDTTLGGGLTTRAGSGNLNYSSTGTPERRNDYLTCMNDRQAQCGWFQSPQSCQEMSANACAGLVGSPTNPQISAPTGD